MGRTRVRMCATPAETASVPVRQPLGWQLLRGTWCWFWRAQFMLNPEKQEGNGCLGNTLDLAQMPGRQRGGKRFFWKAGLQPGYTKHLLHAFSQTQAPAFPDEREQLSLLRLSICFRRRKVRAEGFERQREGESFAPSLCWEGSGWHPGNGGCTVVAEGDQGHRWDGWGG